MSAIRDLPRLIIEVDGTGLAGQIGQSLAEVQVRQRLSMPAQCQIAFRDPPAAGIERLRPGAPLRLLVRQVETPLFSGEITACEHVYQSERGRELWVRAYDPLHRLRKRQRLSAYAELTLADLAREFVADLGLSVEAQEDGPFLRHLVQYQQSDLHLLSERAAEYGLYLTVRDGSLHIITLAGIGEPWPLQLGRKLLEARIDVNADRACGEVATSGWSPLSAEVHAGRASNPRLGRSIDAAGRTEAAGASGLASLLDIPVSTADEAEAFAQAELDNRAASEVTFWGVAEGDPNLRPGAIVDVQGVDKELAGNYVLTEVVHIIDDRHGFVSELFTEPPAPVGRSHSAFMTPGIVSRVDDPEGLARVRVTLPTFGDVESDWMGVLCVAAGSGKGLVALPDIGDSVLVLCAEGDPAHGIVLGGLYGVHGAPDHGVSGGAVRRFTFLTPGGQRLTLDDERSELKIENDQGSCIELSPDEVRLHSATDLLIEAPGQSLVIQAASIDFRRA